MVAFLGWIDFLTTNFSMDVGYIVPIALGAWCSGRIVGSVIAIGSTLASLISDMACQHSSHVTYVQGWNSVMLLFLFSVVTFLLASLKESQTNLECKIKERTQDLVRMNEELKNAQSRLTESAKNELIGRLAIGVAHEVKNPLMTVTMAVDYFAYSVQRDDVNGIGMVKDMREAVARANRVISELLELSRPHELTLKPENLSDVINQALGLAKMELNRKHIHVCKNLRDFIAIPMDRNKFIQMLLNLIMNAIHSMPVAGTLKVGIISHENLETATLAVEIEDTGPGISDTSLTKLFEPFFTTKKTGEGTGLGLSVSRQIAQQHGGTLTLTNRPEGGAKAKIEFQMN